MKDKPVAAPGSVGGCPGERLLVVCDFDGTVCRVDMGNAFLERFAEGWEEIDRSYSAGEVGSRVAYSRIAPLFRANRSQVLDFVLRRERLDPFFPEFLSFCRGRKIDLKIVSDGLDTYIEEILEKHGLDVEFFSNRLVFREDDRIEFDFPPASEECGCGGVPKLVNLVINHRLFFYICIRSRNISLRLVIIVIRNEIVNGIIRKKFPKFISELGSQGFIVGDDQCRQANPCNHICQSKGFS